MAMKKPVLVTGAFGFSGSRIVAYLLDQGYSVVATARRCPERYVLPENLQIVQGDLCDPGTLARVPPVSAIVHAAGTSAGRPIDITRDNVGGTEQIVSFACRTEAPVIFLSTISAFGTIDTDIVDPLSRSIDPKPYGLSKLLCETMIMQAWESTGAISLRLPGIVGRGAVRNWLSQIVAKAQKGEPVEYYGPSALFNNALHIQTLCTFIGSLLQRKIAGYDMVTLGSSGAMSVRELVDTIVSTFGNRSQVSVNCPGGPAPFIISNERAIERYGFAPLSIRGTLRRYMEDIA